MSVCEYVCVIMHVCASVCVHAVCMYVHDMYMRMCHTHTCVCTYVCMLGCLGTCVYVYVPLWYIIAAVLCTFACIRKFTLSIELHLYHPVYIGSVALSKPQVL